MTRTLGTVFATVAHGLQFADVKCVSTLPVDR